MGSQNNENKLISSFQARPIRPLALKLNNFLLWGAAGCVNPYFSVYFLHYAGASEKEFGQLMAPAAVLGIVMNLMLSSLSDRYRIHRLVYLLSLASTYLALGLLLVPINFSASRKVSQTLNGLVSDEIHLQSMRNETNFEQMARNEPDAMPLLWIRIIGACLLIGSPGLAATMNFSESFTANIGHSHCENGGKESYCSIRFFGALGWCLASLVLSQVDEQSLGLPYLLVPWLLFACLYGLNVILVMVWPDGRPFNLAPETVAPMKQINLLTFESSGKQKCRLFDDGPQKCPNMIGLTGSYVARKSDELSRVDWANLQTIDRFKLEKINSETRSINLLCNINHANEVERRPTNKLAKSRPTSLKMYLKIIELIGRRNKNVPRFMVLYAIIGFVAAMNWNFLFPYLNELNPAKFRQLGPYVMMSGYLSEVLFYYYASSRISFKMKPSVGLSCVLLVFSIRYLAYFTFAHWPQATYWPMEMMIAIELLQSLTVCQFAIILNESALEFALEAEHCLPQLIELELIGDCQAETREMVKSSVKLSLACLSVCFSDGLGVALGSLVGGWLIVRHNYSTLWLVTAAISLFAAMANQLLEWTLFRSSR